jgi:hypothetical protein
LASSVYLFAVSERLSKLSWKELKHVYNFQNQGYIEPGQSGYLHGIRFGHTVITLKIFEFRSTDWTSEQVMQSDMPELTTWRFVSSPDEAGNQAKMEMGLNAVTSRGTLVWPEF